MAWIAQFADVVAVIFPGIAFLNLTFASIWLFIVAAENIRNDVTLFNSFLETVKDENRKELLEHFCAVVQHYLDAKQFVGFD